ncbi:unnamed protein product [Caretta caretta]
MPHHHIFAMLQEFGMPENFLHVIQEPYEGCSTTICSDAGETTEIQSGVKQGCALSPIIFNLAMEPLLRALSKGTDGFNLHGERVSVLAYADDPEPPRYARRHQSSCQLGLLLSAKKCAALHIDSSKRDSVQATGFQIQGKPVIPLAEGQVY